MNEGDMSRARHEDDEVGFTLVEMVVAIALSALALAALAALLAGSLRALAVSKARTQGNEVATQGIEDLQRLRYDDLGLCGAPDPPAATPPAGLSDTVILPACSGATPKYQPCTTATPASGAVPAEIYPCTRVNITYNVKRYVAYGDVGHTEKRLAVFVTWNDSAGAHTVSQQSSLRIPSQAALVGLPPPRVTAGSASPLTVPLDGSGHNTIDVAISATTSGLTTADSVVVGFSTLDGGQPSQQTLALTTTDGTTWTGAIPSGGTPHIFGNGSQILVFTAVRKSDGKVGSLPYAASPQPLTFGGPRPHLNAPDVTPTTVHVTGSGELNSAVTPSFTLTVHSTNISPTDTVSAVFDTLTGAVAVAMQPDPFACDLSSCVTTWHATITSTAGYHFRTGTLNVYFRAIQGVTPATVDAGDTDIAAASLSLVNP